MSAIIIILPTLHISRWDACPSDCEPPEDHQSERVDLSQFLLGGRPPRSKPVLAYNRSRIVTDDDFAGGNDAA